MKHLLIVSFVLHPYLQVIAPDAMLNPEGLPTCDQFAGGLCEGDGSTLKERLEALHAVGRVNVSGISSGLDIVGDDAEVCGVDRVSKRECVPSRSLDQGQN